MTSLRTIAVALSLMVHGSLAFAMWPSQNRVAIEALDAGAGDDAILVEQGIAIEGLVKLGEALETIETAEVTPIEQATPPPLEEVKPVEELRDAITSDASVVEDNIVKTEEPPPPVVEQKQPEAVEVKEQPQQVALISEQSSGEAKSGGDARAYGLYLGEINKYVQRSKVNPRSRLAGTVVMRFTIGLDGQLLSKEVAASSGSPVLDEAATAALDRAAPFPPIPPDVSIKPLAFTQPFKFVTR